MRRVHDGCERMLRSPHGYTLHAINPKNELSRGGATSAQKPEPSSQANPSEQDLINQSGLAKPEVIPKPICSQVSFTGSRLDRWVRDEISGLSRPGQTTL